MLGLHLRKMSLSYKYTVYSAVKGHAIKLLHNNIKGYKLDYSTMSYAYAFHHHRYM